MVDIYKNSLNSCHSFLLSVLNPDRFVEKFVSSLSVMQATASDVHLVTDDVRDAVVVVLWC